jgi:hypothetical protein
MSEHLLSRGGMNAFVGERGSESVPQAVESKPLIRKARSL